MGKTTRRKFTPEFKAKVALEALILFVGMTRLATYAELLFTSRKA